MLHYFHTHGDLFQAVLIPVHCFDTLHQARASEYSLIHSWKPQLNAPWIVPLNPTSTTRFTQPFTVKSCYGSPGKRLWLKVRRKLRTLGLLRLYDNTLLEPYDNWLLLMNIANRGMKAFQAEKRLRSAEFHNHQIYALYRLCNLLDDPPQTAVRAVLRRILTFRQCAIPKGPKPLVLPLLAHESFQCNVEQWISNIIIDSKDYMIPFHLPHKKCVAGKHRSLRDIVYNNIAIVEHWHWDIPPSCNCAKLRLQHPQAQVIDGHIASPLSLFSFSKRLRRLLQYSMDSQLFPNFHCYLNISWPKVQRWLFHHNVFTISFQDWEAFVQQEWSYHKHAVFTRLKYKDAAFIKHSLQDLFIHGRDHAITHGHAFCPQFVWQTYKKTFGDTHVYERLPMQPSQAQEFLLSTCSRSFLQRYKWGINLRTSSLPIAYLLLKQKKDFKGARPIISYIHFLYAKLFRATTIALDVIMRATCPRSFGLHTLPSILQQLTEFLQMLPDDAHPVVFSQDLVGFFTSIPVVRILNAVKWAVNEYSMLQKTDIDDITFSVNLREQDTKLRVWRGRPRRAAKRTVLIHLSDIVDICQLSCEASVFTVMHKVFRQTRGATIGNQISPMLAGLTVSIEEEIYVRHLQSFFDAYKPLFFCTRYVDNRLVIVSDRILRDYRLQHFLHNNFYQHPVELEHVTSSDAIEEFLGIDLQLNHHRLQLLLRPDLWKIREPNSAGPERHRTAAFQCAKIHIERHVWPPHIRAQQLLRLRQNFAEAGYTNL